MDESQDVGNAQPVGDVSTGVPAEEPAVVDSTPTEQTPEQVPEASEKTEITQEGETQEQEEARIPKERLDQEIGKRRELEEKISSLEEKAGLLDQLQTNPELAQAVLKNFTKSETQSADPVVQKADQRLKDMGYVKAEDVQNFVNQTIEQREVKQQYLTEVQRLEKEYDGSDGLPKFEADKVAKYMDENGFLRDASGNIDVETTFKAMNVDAFADGQAKRSKSTAFSEKPGAPMQTADVDNRKGDLEKASKSGNWTDYFVKNHPHKN